MKDESMTIFAVSNRINKKYNMVHSTSMHHLTGLSFFQMLAAIYQFSWLVEVLSPW